MAATGEFEIGDTTERRISDDTGVFVSPAHVSTSEQHVPDDDIEDATRSVHGNEKTTGETTGVRGNRRSVRDGDGGVATVVTIAGAWTSIVDGSPSSPDDSIPG